MSCSTSEQDIKHSESRFKTMIYMYFQKGNSDFDYTHSNVLF